LFPSNVKKKKGDRDRKKRKEKEKHVREKTSGYPVLAGCYI